jgi:hypothetical protein
MALTHDILFTLHQKSAGGCVRQFVREKPVHLEVHSTMVRAGRGQAGVRPRTTYVEASGSEDDEAEKATAAAPAPIKKRAIKTSDVTVKTPVVR